jgi:TonB family protein
VKNFGKEFCSMQTPIKVISFFSFVMLFLIVGSSITQAQQPNTISEETKRGIELYNQNKNEEAIQSLRLAVKANKQDAEAWNYLGLALARGGNQQEARKAFEQSLKINPNGVKPRVSLTAVLLNLNKVKDAEKEAKKTLAIAPQSAEAHYAMALVFLRKQKSSQKALNELDSALKIEPKFSKAWLTKSQAYIDMFSEEFSEDKSRFIYLKQAADAIEEYLKLEPNDKDAVMLRERMEALRFYSRHGSMEIKQVEDGEQIVYTAKNVSTRARITFKPQPEYTESARRNQISGIVRVMVVLSFDGKVKHILVVSRLPEGLNEAALRATSKIKFEPATKDGKPVSQVVTLEYSFRIY